MNKNLKTIIDAIKSAAKEHDIHPQLVTKVMIIDKVSDWEIRKIGGLSGVLKAHFPQQDKDLASINNVKKQASYIQKLEKALGEKIVNDERVLEIFNGLKLPKVKEYKSKKKSKISRAVNLVLSDLHFGSDISKNKTGGLDFGKIEEARRLAKVTQEVITYKPQYRKETELNVLLLGDLIQNQLHDMRDGAPMAEQVCRAIHLLSQTLTHFTNNFPQVNVYVNSGNHGRNTSRHHNRAVNDKWDSLESIICYALKNTFKNVKNIKFEIPLTPYVTYEVFGKKIFASHGDTVIKPGFVGKSINTGSLETQINKINATLNDNDEYAVFICGHIHTGSTTHLGNGAVMITNGALVPSDEFAVSIGLLENSCGQMLFESVPGYPVGDVRFIRVNQKDDENKELDKIIQKFTGL